MLGSTQLITLLITFVRLKTIAILLGPAGVGLIGLYSAFLELMTALSRFGVNESGVREIAASDGNSIELHKLAQAIDRLSFFGGVAGWLVTVLLSSTISQWLFDSSQYASSLMILGAAVLLGTIASGRLAVIQGLGQVGYLARVNIGLAIGGTTIAVLGYYWVGERGIVPVLVLTGLAQAALAWWYSRKLMPGRATFSWAQTLETSNGLIKLGIALMYGVVLAAVTLLALRAIIVHFLGIEDSGFYQAAWSISGILSGFLVSAMSTDYYPRLAAVAEDNDAVNRLVNDQIEISALLATPGLVTATVLATVLHLIDYPKGRKQHAEPTPVIGGIAITLAFLSLFFTMPDLFMQHWVIFASVVVLMFVGIADDIAQIHSAVRMLIQIGIGCAIYFEGNLPFRSVGDIWFIGDLGLGPYSLTFTCIAVVGGVNAVNMMDGLDGLCGLMVVSALFWLSGMAYYIGHTDVLALSLVLLAAVITFLVFNYRFPWNNRARIFLGDSGAYVLGFMIAALFLMATQGPYKGGTQVLTPVTALWLLIIPLVDIAGVIWRRSRGSRWPVDNDREHLHYILVDRGYSTERVVNGLFVIALMLGGLGVVFYYLGVTESWSYVVFMSVCVGYFLVTNRLSQKA